MKIGFVTKAVSPDLRPPEAIGGSELKANGKLVLAGTNQSQLGRWTSVSRHWSEE